MKKFLSIIIFISIALSSYSQAVVIDATRQASDVAIGSEEQAEEEVQKTALEKIQEFSKKTQSIMDSVNVYMNMATDYVRTAKQLKQAIELLSKTVIQRHWRLLEHQIITKSSMHSMICVGSTVLGLIHPRKCLLNYTVTGK